MNVLILDTFDIYFVKCVTKIEMSFIYLPYIMDIIINSRFFLCIHLSLVQISEAFNNYHNTSIILEKCSKIFYSCSNRHMDSTVYIFW